MYSCNNSIIFVINARKHLASFDALCNDAVLLRSLYLPIELAVRDVHVSELVEAKQFLRHKRLRSHINDDNNDDECMPN